MKFTIGCKRVAEWNIKTAQLIAKIYFLVSIYQINQPKLIWLAILDFSFPTSSAQSDFQDKPIIENKMNKNLDIQQGHNSGHITSLTSILTPKVQQVLLERAVLSAGFRIS